MANMSINIANAPDLIRKLRERGALHPKVLHDRFNREQNFENVLDFARCSEKNLHEEEEANFYPVIIDTPNQLHYLCRYVPYDEAQWRISLLLPNETINGYAVVEGDEREDFWQFRNGKDVSHEEWRPEPSGIAKVRLLQSD